MQPAFHQHRLPSPLETPPVVLFRVECHDQHARKYNGTFQNFNMVARGPDRPITWRAFDDCLSWQRVNTPFIPFTSRWERALGRRRLLMDNGANNVVIVAIWSKGLRNVYDAYQVAMELGYPEDNSNRRKRLVNHLDEYLVLGGIPADEYRVLAFFGGQDKETNVELRLPGLLRGTTQIPGTFITDTPGRTANEKLENEIYIRTGIKGQSEQLLCLIGVMIRAFDHIWTSFVVVPLHQG